MKALKQFVGGVVSALVMVVPALTVYLKSDIATFLLS